ncbi:MarR family transcriptional regulator [Actinomycetaceae bacterium MB13-C1-2]|nr:MarR family transcriptional regulator [Actinomycetaceae bacterium MB13-C1-2]
MNQELNEKMMQTIGLLRYQRRQARRASDVRSDPSQGQGRVLAALKLQDKIATKDLAYVLGLHPASLNETLAKLTKEGYITREQSPEDGRVMLVKLTDKGRALQQQGHPSPLGNVFDCLDQSEQANMAGYLDRVNAALKNQLGVDEDFDPSALRRHGHGRGDHGPGSDHDRRHQDGEHGGRGGRGPHGEGRRRGPRGDDRGRGRRDDRNHGPHRGTGPGGFPPEDFPQNGTDPEN